MNLFQPYPGDLKKNARTIDDKRLNKQVVEAYQVGNVVLRKMRDPNAKISWSNHPACRFVYNGGKPKFPWLRSYIEACDLEWRHRGFHRSEEFLAKIDTLFAEAEEYSATFSHEPVVAYVGGGLDVIEFGGTTRTVGAAYRKLLEQKWEKDREAGRPPKWTTPD
jgi:hypothetical protein